MSKSCLFVLSAASNESFWEAFIPSISSSMSLSELEVLGDLFVVDITDLLTDSLSIIDDLCCYSINVNCGSQLHTTTTYTMG
jgi:hypothetical protein